MGSVDYNNPIGVWRVTTEGDCEGRTTRDLGIYEGHIVDIAAALGRFAYYSLHFRRVEEAKLPPVPDGAQRVPIVLDIESGTWGMSPTERADHIANMLGPHPRLLEVAKGGIYAGVTLVMK